jgi:Raf kinase inhibitor-like YbhB/YbcL family protein
MKAIMKQLSTIVFSAFLLLTLANVASPQDWRWDKFRLSSSEFKEGATLPISAISEFAGPNGANECSIDGSTGGNQSPQLSWKDPPPYTRSFVVTVFDTTAGVTHWGMYNISGEKRSLPQNAGVAGSAYGLQVVNVFGDQSYDGPCPPADYPPNNHHYLFTVYALDTELDLFSPPNFPASALTLYRALLEAGRSNHILASASLLSFYSTTLSSN